jgi:CysZ protein
LNDLLAGLRYPLRALGIINRNRRLWKFVTIPILVNIVAGAILYLGVLLPLLGALDARIPDEGSALAAALLWALRVATALTLGVGIGFVLVRFGVVLGAPWYGQLSEELEGMLTGRPSPAKPLSAREVVYDIWRALQFEGKKLLLVLSIWLPSLLLLLIPVAGSLLYAAAGFALGATVSCLDFFDGPLERRRLGFRQKLALVRSLLPASASFGLVAFALVSIPLVNLLAIPLCVAAGNILVVEEGILRRSAQPLATLPTPPPASAAPAEGDTAQ